MVVFSSIKTTSERFRELVETDGYDALDYWYPKLCPSIRGMERARKACLVTLASGEDSDIRRRVHTLLVGPPGTGKTRLRNWIMRHFGAVGAGPKSTEAGLKWNSRTGQPGALRMADGGVLLVDELEKLVDTDPLLEAMEEGIYQVHSGGYHMSVKAECRVIACANDISELSGALMDRFDLVVRVEIRNKEEEKDISNHIYDAYLNGVEDTAGELMDYLHWVRPFTPEVPPEVRSRIKELKDYYIDSRADWSPNVRQKESFLRVAESISKLNNRNVTVEDFERAILLVDPDAGELLGRRARI